MPEIQVVIADFRRRLHARQADVLGEVARLYESVLTDLDERVTAILSEAGDGPLTTGALFERNRLQRIRAEMHALLTEVNPRAAAAIAAGQEAGVTLATQAVPAFVNAGSTVGIDIAARVPREALTNMIGALADGSPLLDALDRIVDGRVAAARSELVRAAAFGENPRTAARRLRKLGVGSRARAERVARNEILRAHRTATLDGYRALGDLVVGWRWLSARNRRTCPICLAMDGDVFPLSTPFASHIACRCTIVSVLRQALRSNVEMGTGMEAFNAMSADDQQFILGPAKYDALRDGRLRSLRDLVGYEHDRNWGPSRYEKSLRDAVQGRSSATASA